MRNLCVLASALEIVEQNLCNPLKITDLARACHISVSGLQKLFGYAFYCSAGRYVAKRRLSAATKAIITTGRKITDIALDYQYASPEVFTKAFKRFWGASPSEYRKGHRFSELFPKFVLENYNGGHIMTKSRRVDISELYEELKKLGDTYVLCADVCNLMNINKTHGHTVGDLVIAEAAKRIEQELSSDMLMFRIGGDEFAILSGCRTRAEAEELMQAISSHNGRILSANGKEVPLYLRIGINKISAGGLNCQETFTLMMETVGSARRPRITR